MDISIPDEEPSLQETLANFVQIDILSELQQAITLQQQGELEQAENIYIKILHIKPDEINALSMLGTVSLKRGNYQQAEAYLKQALKFNQQQPNIYFNLGIALEKLEKFKEAQQLFTELTQLTPTDPKAYLHLGISLEKQNLTNEAIMAYHKVLKYNPTNIVAQNNLAMLNAARNRYLEAIITLQKVISLAPNYAQAYCNLAKCLYHGPREINKAINNAEKAMVLDKNRVEAILFLIELWLEKHDLINAENNINLALEIIGTDPDKKLLKAKIYYYQAKLWLLKNNLAAAYSLLQQAYALNPHDKEVLNNLYQVGEQLCAWQETMPLIAKLLVNAPLNYLIKQDDPIETRKIASARANYLSHKIMPFSKQFSYNTTKHNHAKLTIGYISGALHQENIAYILRRFCELHNKNYLNIFVYSYGQVEKNNIKHKFTTICDKFFDFSDSSDVDAAHCINIDQVDILVDLHGFLPGQRIEILALKPAPLQINYPIYPGTNGADFFDYIIADPVVAPVENQEYYTENILNLPNCYYFADQEKTVVDNRQFTRAEVNLPEEALVLACFNPGYQYNANCLAVWARILKSNINTVLWLYSFSAEQENFIKKFLVAHNIASTRIYFAQQVPALQHMARYQVVDLMLDTFPYNGADPTKEALLNNVPVITMMGKSLATRRAASMLTAVGLQECITMSPIEYENKILALLSDPAALANLKIKLSKNLPNSCLVKPKQFVQNLENLYKKIWSQYLDGIR